MSETILTTIFHSPNGDLLLGTLHNKLCLCDWASRRNRTTIQNRLKRRLKAEIADPTPADDPELHPILAKAIKQLSEYFAGNRQRFTIALLPAGTKFQIQAWSELMKIPYGQTISYAEQAGRMNMESAVRAVANANGANAISIFIPCHRVIGSDGELSGYAGGIRAKERLLELEQGVRELFI